MVDVRGWTDHPFLISWIEKAVTHCRPEKIHLCDGSLEEYQKLCNELVQNGTFILLNPQKRPNSFYCRSNPNDVARVEEATFICSHSKEDAGPTNNWKDPKEMHALLDRLFEGCMEGRTLYVIPFCMGVLNSPLAKIGVQITDSPYVVCSMFVMTRMGKKALDILGNEGSFVPCLHSLGAPLKKGQKDTHWPCNDQKYIVHFPEEKSIISFGSGYGGNALLGKKSLALRIASVMAKEEGWMAEHMLIVGLTNPEGKKKYFAAAFPSQCGKTNLAMINSTLPGWKAGCVGDDIAWMKFDKEGNLRAINPEAGFFGVAPGTSFESNPNAMRMIAKNTIFTNTALTSDRDVWWEGMTKTPPPALTDWLGAPWIPNKGTTASHPNARFTVPIRQCPIIDPAWESPEGVPISGIIFGGRRSAVIPLVFEALNWQHGVFLGASISSETTAAAQGQIGKLRHDPFAMLPFCGYHMGDYFAHWLKMGKKSPKLPRIFYVNWFRKAPDGSWLWPGFGHNIRVLKWIFERTSNSGKAKQIPIGYIPDQEALDLSGLNVPAQNLSQLFKFDSEGWRKECADLREYFQLFGTKMPKELLEELNQLEKRCGF
jgi:phosphoenolpyruvate carboxykinase (GTP)